MTPSNRASFVYPPVEGRSHPQLPYQLSFDAVLPNGAGNTSVFSLSVQEFEQLHADMAVVIAAYKRFRSVQDPFEQAQLKAIAETQAQLALATQAQPPSVAERTFAPAKP